MEFNLYTDGSCSVNTGKGGWAFLVTEGDRVVYENNGRGLDTTNNQMELQAVIEGIKFMELAYNDLMQYTIYTDSAYIVNCFKDCWYRNWLRNGWKTATKMPVKNKEQWEIIINKFILGKHKFTVEKVEAHSTNKFNNRCDELACMWRGREKK